MRIFFIGCLSLLPSPFTLAATLPGNPAPALESPPSPDEPIPPYCLRDDPICPRPLPGDCVHLLRMLTLDAQTARYVYTFVSRPVEAADEWQVPATYVSGTCRITIAMVPGEYLELSSFQEVAERASPLILDCLGPATPQYYGGYNVAGVADTLVVLVHGRALRSTILTQAGSANHTAADLTRRAVNQERWCRRIDEGRIYPLGDLKQALDAVNGSVAASGTRGVTPVGRGDLPHKGGGTTG